MTNGQKPSRFASLAARIADAKEKVDVVQDSKTVSAQELQTIKQQSALGLLGDANVIKQLEEAEQATGSDPLVRYHWIVARLGELAQMESIIDPELAFRVISLARAKTMPDKKTPTHSVVVDFDRYDLAQAHADTLGKGIRPIPMPFTFYDEGRLRMRGTRFCVPNMKADVPHFFKIRKILEYVQESVKLTLEDQNLFDRQLAAEWIVRSFRKAFIVDAKRLAQGYDEKDGLYVNKKKETFLKHTVGPEEHLLLPDNPRNRSVIAELEKLERNLGLLKAGELAMDVAIIRQLRMEDAPAISPREFLGGTHGRTAIRIRDWRHAGQKLDVQLLAERRTDGAWRVLLFNWGAAEALLVSPKGELRYTWFSTRRIPDRLADALKRGSTITGPEDLGLTEEDVAIAAPSEDDGDAKAIA